MDRRRDPPSPTSSWTLDGPHTGCVPDDFPGGLSYEAQRGWRQAGYLGDPHAGALAVEDGADVVGVVAAGRSRFDPPPFEADRMPHASCRTVSAKGWVALRERGLRSVSVRVFAPCPACRLYQRRGGMFVDVGGCRPRPSFYGWRDLGAPVPPGPDQGANDVRRRRVPDPTAVQPPHACFSVR